MQDLATNFGIACACSNPRGQALGDPKSGVLVENWTPRSSVRYRVHMTASRIAGVLLALASIPVCVLSAACRPAAQPGTPVGTFAITGTLQDNACGDGFQPQLTIAFNAELRRTESVAYWKMGDRPATSGTIDANGNFRFRSQSLIDAWPADAANGIVGCRLLQTETISGRVSALSESNVDASDSGRADAGTAQRDAGRRDAGPAGTMELTATNTIDIAASPGSDCSPAVVFAGGPFTSLPCRASFSLDGLATR